MRATRILLVLALIVPWSACGPVARALLDTFRVTSIDPSDGPRSGGTLVTVTCDNLSGSRATDIQVLIGGQPLQNWQWTGHDRISGFTPPGAVGPADVEVDGTVPGLSNEHTVSSVLPGGFTYH